MRWSIAFIIVFFANLCCAQLKNWSLLTSAQVGKMIKHTPKLTFEPPRSIQGITFNLQYQTTGTKDWHQWQNYPKLGVAITFNNLGNEHLLGNAIAIVPNITKTLWDRTKLKSHFMFGTGVAYVTKPFNYLTNPSNNSIGSHFNNTTVFSFDVERQLTRNLDLNLAATLTHYSNGSFQLPNLGMNIPMVQIGARYIPNRIDKKDFKPAEKSRIPEHRFGLTLNYSMAFTAIGPPGGPKYPFYLGQIGGLYKWNKVHQLIIGGEYEYVSSVFHFALQSTEVKNDSDARKLATRNSLFLGEEFFFWPFSVAIIAGYYLGGPPYLASGGNIYTKLSTRYYFEPIGTPGTRLFFAVHLKAHKFTAEYISLGFGAML